MTNTQTLIRLAVEEDAGAVLEIYAPYVRSTPASFETEVPDVEIMRSRISSTLKSHPWLVCETQGEVLGYAYASPYRSRAAYVWSLEVSAYVHPQAQHKGIGRALYTSLFQILKLQGIYNLYAVITLPNPASVGLHEALGFSPIGVFDHVGYKLGAWHNVGWWHLALQEPSSQPIKPLLLEEIKNSPGLADALKTGISLLRTQGN
jgi:phosphinothricin acetyltransferase